MSSERTRYVYAASRGQRIYFSPRWSRPVPSRKVSWILPAYARAIFLKKSFIIGISLAVAFYPMAPIAVIADDTAPESEPVLESEPAEAEAEEAPAEEEPAEEGVAPEEVVGTDAEPDVAATASSEPEVAPDSEASPCDEGAPVDEHENGTVIENCNEAETKSDVTASSDTGENAIVIEESDAGGEEDGADTDELTEADTGSIVAEPAVAEVAPDEGIDSAIDTGDAGATAVLIQDVNTNIVGSDVDKEVIVADGETGDIDLLDAFVGAEEENGEAVGMNQFEESDGSDGEVAVVNGNEATVESTVVATAETGNNSIEGGDGASIDTGDASALAVAVNVVNTTLVGSNGLLAIVNIVGDYAGDVILPGEGLLSFGDGNPSLQTVENGNEATIENAVAATADTGGNTIEGSSDASIETGDAVAVAESDTIANTNFVGDNWLVVVVNVFGEWLGGIVDGEDADGDGVIGFFFGGGGESDGCDADCGDVGSVSGKNVAYVVNTVSASADTGSNTIAGVDDASIATGNATATAAAFNFVNNNIVGHNWLLAVINVFGSWGGDLVFAYPDLSTSVSDGRETALPGDTLEYAVQVENGGVADAEGVSVAFRIPESSEYRSASDGAERDGDMVIWTLSSLKKGESKGFSVAVDVNGETPDGAELRAYAQAGTDTAEKHSDNNSSDDETIVDIPDTRITEIDADDDQYHTGLRVKRSKPDGTFRGGDTVTHRITVENTGKNPAYDVVAEDSFETPDGTLIATLEWNIGGIDSGKGVLIEYTIAIPDQVGAGQYRYATRAEGKQYDDDDIRSKKAYATLTVVGSAFAGVFGAETVEAAPPEDMTIPGEVQGAQAAMLEELAGSKEFPIWMLLLSGLVYILMINWSFFPVDKRRII